MNDYNKWVSRRQSHCSLDDMLYNAKHNFVRVPKKGDLISVNDRMQKGYKYRLQKSPARSVKYVWKEVRRPDGSVFSFRPKYLPHQMLRKGVFGGKMINDCMNEYPTSWYIGAIKSKKLRPDKRDIFVNMYKVDSGKPLKYWRKKNWIRGDDPRGWFQWYCRYCLGRRHPIDRWQMQRWSNIQRFYKRYKRKGGTPVVRQLLLQWSWPHS